MDLRELGAMLRAERERQGLSVEDVADKIKISRGCVTAIEDGNQSVLPHPVYAKGFIKNYARLLGVDQEEFSRQLASVYPAEEASPLGHVPLVKDIPDDPGSPPSRNRTRVPLGPAGLALAVVVVVAGLGWYLYAHVFARSGEVTEKAAPVATEAKSSPAPTETPAAPVPVVPPQTPQDAAPAPAQPAAEAAPAATPPETATKLPPAPAPKAQAAPSADDQITQDIADSGPATPATPPAIPPAPEPPAAPNQPAAKTFTVGDAGPHTVSIVANERCWLQAGADGGAMRETMLEKGDAFTGRFADYLLVRLGNAGAVEIRFDNKLYPLQASKGAVKTLKFVAKKGDAAAPAAGPAPAAPAATATPAPATPSPAPAAVASPAAVPAAGANEQAAKEVEIYGQDGSWVIINPDKGPAKEIYVKKGQRLTVPFNEKIDIKLGNPSNVVFRYNGKETAVTTEKGESKSIHFPQ